MAAAGEKFRGEPLSDAARQLMEARSGRDLMAKGANAFKSSGAMEKRKSTSGGWKKRYLNLEEVSPGSFELGYYADKFMLKRKGGLTLEGAQVMPCQFSSGKPTRGREAAKAQGWVLRQPGQTAKDGYDHWFYQGPKASEGDATVVEWVAMLQACGAELSDDIKSRHRAIE